ncbi:DUF4878 domain-containing lipoprotein [Aliarcobacter faecis]|uniref:DUF4878 domain-containing protein n=1 Tax=Aliarcobacter faecis TaxID=1564138 RepID=UPI000478D8D2|nr:DUF4878 domain-containing protein [Aliarcobacter faecis]QKF73022.1 DUF4878 domain-containing lipoprotein [Aliarcobacter faecis]
MRRGLKASILAVASTVLFTACGTESPKEATEKFYTSLKNGDVATYKKYSTETTQRLMGLTFTMGCFNKDLKQESELSACMKDIFKDMSSFKVLDVKDNNKVSATVIVEEKTKDGVKNNTLELQKLDEQWKVSIKK